MTHILKAHFPGIKRAYGTDTFEYVATYHKGRLKTKKPKVLNIRVMVRDESGSEFIIYPAAHFMGAATMQFIRFGGGGVKVIDPGKHLKNGVYNYYYLDDDHTIVNELLQIHKDNVKMVPDPNRPFGGGMWVDRSTVPWVPQYGFDGEDF